MTPLRVVSVDRKERLSLEKLEAQLKACLCRISFSRAKVRPQNPASLEVLNPDRNTEPSLSPQPSVLALSLLQQEMGAVRSEDMLEIASHIQRHLKVRPPPQGGLLLKVSPGRETYFTFLIFVHFRQRVINFIVYNFRFSVFASAAGER